MRARFFTAAALACVGILTAAATADPRVSNGGWVQNPENGQKYRLTEPLSWPEAEQQAVAWGGHLATLKSAKEEQLLRERFGKLEYFWIGFNDIEVEGVFEWASGKRVKYTNWCEGEPNNFNDEDAAIINWAHAPASFGDCWNDLPIQASLRGIVEKK